MPVTAFYSYQFKNPIELSVKSNTIFQFNRRQPIYRWSAIIIAVTLLGALLFSRLLGVAPQSSSPTYRQVEAALGTEDTNHTSKLETQTELTATVGSSTAATAVITQANGGLAVPVTVPITTNVVGGGTVVRNDTIIRSSTVATTVQKTAAEPVAAMGEEAVAQLPLTQTLNILVLGSDRRTSATNWRTDVIMIFALDFEQERAGVISIPRDLYMDAIPNHQPNRINVIDYLGEQDGAEAGGPALLAGLIEKNMGVRIDHFLRFDFESFKEVVDALGGVDLALDCPFRDNFFATVEPVLEPGTVHLDGTEALAYVRSRRFGGDLDRARRQQRFVWAVRNQMLAQNLLPRVPALYKALNDSIQTDIGIVSAIRIVRFALDLQEADLHGVVLAPPELLTPGWRAGMSVFVPKWPDIQSAVQTVFETNAFVETNTPSRCP